MAERITLGAIDLNIQQQLKNIVFNSGADNTPVSRKCFLIKKEDLELAQEVVQDLQWRVNAIEGTPGIVSIYGRYFDSDKIIIFWRARISEAIEIAVTTSNSDRIKTNRPSLPSLS